MDHRSRAQQRLERHVPGVAERSSRAPWSRVLGRAEEEERPVRPVPGDRLLHRDGAVQSMKVTVRAEPNAPLLMRLVRHPFALPPVRFARVEGRPVYAKRELPAREPILGARDEFREGASFANPILVFAHRPDPRPFPFARARAAGEVDDE